jgi:hypothetical protein
LVLQGLLRHLTHGPTLTAGTVLDPEEGFMLGESFTLH